MLHLLTEQKHGSYSMKISEYILNCITHKNSNDILWCTKCVMIHHTIVYLKSSWVWTNVPVQSVVMFIFLFFLCVTEQKPPGGGQARLGAAVQVGAWTKCLTVLARGWPGEVTFREGASQLSQSLNAFDQRMSNLKSNIYVKRKNIK